MGFEVKFRCSYNIDWPLDKLQIKGLRSVFNSSNTEVLYREEMSISTNISSFLEFCTICILSEQGTSDRVDLANYGIRFGRETFDDRYFYCGDMQICVGEVYFMYEILKKKINTRGLKMYKFTDRYYIFIARERYVFIADKSLLNIGFFRYDLFNVANFSVKDKIKDGQVGYDIKVPIGKIQYAIMERGACHPYVNLHYRDMCVNMSLTDWETLKRVLFYYEYED